MADGAVKAIDQVEPGDEVVATDPETGERKSKLVEAVHGHDDVMLTLVLTTSTGEKREILTTEDHPFWSESDQEYQRADELAPGEVVLTADGGSMEVHAVETQEVTYGPAWNLTVQDLHTYSVIATGADVGAGSTRGPPAAARADAVLVHNCSIQLGSTIPVRSPAGVGSGGAKNYRDTFFAANPTLKSSDFVVHHAVERQVLKKYPDLFSADELNSLPNLRGIPKKSNSSVHLSDIRVLWNGFYKTHSKPSRRQVLDYATFVDDFLGSEMVPRIR